MARRLAAVSFAVLLAAGCGQNAPTVSPAGPRGTSGASGALTASPSPAAPPTAAQPTAALPSTIPAAVPSGPAPAVTLQRVASVDHALAIANLHDGSSRLLVASQTGQIWAIDASGRRSEAPILDLAGRITSGGERGLLGLAAHPRFPTDPRLFVNYTDRNGNTVISSFVLGSAPAAGASAPPNSGPLADLGIDPASERVLIQVTQPFPNHNGGGTIFGPDGFLYLGLGDGGGAGDPSGNGQRLNTLLAKMLRIDVDGNSAGLLYAIPSGNPFAGRADARHEIWLYGLRNPWRFSFDRSTGALWIGDVGQGAWEEVDVAPAGMGGLDFGWNRMEGFHCYSPASGCDQAGLTLPVAEYGHGPECSVTGGYVYRGAAFPALVGRYIFGDYCSGAIFAIDAPGDGRRQVQRIGQGASGLAAFGEDEAGELYVANVGDGSVSRVVVAP